MRFHIQQPAFDFMKTGQETESIGVAADKFRRFMMSGSDESGMGQVGFGHDPVAENVDRIRGSVLHSVIDFQCAVPRGGKCKFDAASVNCYGERFFQQRAEFRRKDFCGKFQMKYAGNIRRVREKCFHAAVPVRMNRGGTGLSGGDMEPFTAVFRTDPCRDRGVRDAGEKRLALNWICRFLKIVFGEN